jgi:hypothetical protein
MPETQELNLARLIYDVYPGSDLLPLDPEQDLASLEQLYQRCLDGQLGDTLFRFIVIEICEAAMENGVLDFERAVEAMETAKDQIQAVSDALFEHMLFNVKEPV